jgi:hypothetical protein
MTERKNTTNQGLILSAIALLLFAASNAQALQQEQIGKNRTLQVNSKELSFKCVDGGSKGQMVPNLVTIYKGKEISRYTTWTAKNTSMGGCEVQKATLLQFLSERKKVSINSDGDILWTLADLPSQNQNVISILQERLRKCGGDASLPAQAQGGQWGSGQQTGAALDAGGF